MAAYLQIYSGLGGGGNTSQYLCVAVRRFQKRFLTTYQDGAPYDCHAPCWRWHTDPPSGGCLFCRCLPVSRSGLHLETWHRLLHDPTVRALRTHRHPLMGGFLDFHRRHSRARHHGFAYRANHDDAEHRFALPVAARLLYQGDWRLDVSMSTVRLCITPGVCSCERLLPEGGPTESEKQLPAEDG